MTRSHPSRGAWIEISRVMNLSHSLLGRTPRGVRGLKFDVVKVLSDAPEVAPLAGCVD